MLSKSKLSLAFAFLLLAACSNTYDRIETGGTDRTTVRLDESVPVLVTTPLDGGYRGRIYYGSGSIVARRIDASFSRYARIVDIYPAEFHSLAQLQETIAKNGYGYIVVPVINVWGRNESDWSKIPNEVNVKVTVIDAKTGKEISSDYFEGKNEPSSGLSALFGTKADGPDNLLSELSDDYADSLYGAVIPGFVH